MMMTQPLIPQITQPTPVRNFLLSPSNPKGCLEDSNNGGKAQVPPWHT